MQMQRLRFNALENKRLLLLPLLLRLRERP
jgi:hypothetical protein